MTKKTLKDLPDKKKPKKKVVQSFEELSKILKEYKW
tara:strand:- start:1821 stop:1928 length:108 start_codon:yes stop_codon:yes gene_type:complete